jgi:antitoxin component HigA of HigAB toxin-antitoxin module
MAVYDKDVTDAAAQVKAVNDERTKIQAARTDAAAQAAKPAAKPTTSSDQEVLAEALALKAKLEARLAEAEKQQQELNVLQGLNPDGSKKTATQLLQEKRDQAAADRAALEASDPLFNKAVQPEAPAGYRYTWIGGTSTGQWKLYQTTPAGGAAPAGGGMGGGAATPAAKPTVVGNKTVRKLGGIVQEVNIMSDGSEMVTSEYKDFGARDSVMKMFENTGLGANFITSLMDTIDKVYSENIMPTEAQVLNTIYNSDAYKTRFAANEAIRKRMADGKGRPGDRLLSPFEYIKTEEGYKQILQEAGLPAGFYDQQEDFTKFIENSVSTAELTDRVNIAKNALQNADSKIVKSLQDYYGLSTGDLAAYLLDKDKAFEVIDSRLKYTTEEAKKMYTAAEIGGAALRANQMSDKAFAEEIYAAGKAGQAEEAFQTAATQQKDYERLTGLYGETAGAQDIAREELALAGGTDVTMKKRKLASKERAMFSQKSAVDTTSLGRRNKAADV